MLSNKVPVQRKEAGFYVNPAGPLADFTENQLYDWSSHSEGGAVKKMSQCQTKAGNQNTLSLTLSLSHSLSLDMLNNFCFHLVS